MENIRDVRVLLVEDSPFDAEIVLRQLQKAGYARDVLWVQSGEEALDYLLGMGHYADRDRRVNPEVIFLDLFLPKMGGFELLQLLKVYDWTKSIPVIMLTNSHEEMDMIDSLSQGVVSYIVKPLSQEGLQNALAALEHFQTPKHHLPV